MRIIDLAPFSSADWNPLTSGTHLFLKSKDKEDATTLTKASLLVVAYNFPPFSDASAVTVAKRVVDFDEPIDVISQDLSKIRTTDFQLSSLVEPFIECHYQVQGDPTFASWKGIAIFVARSMIFLSEKLRDGQYSRIYSRSMFPASHFLAAHIKSQFPDIYWIAEFSDPISHTVEGKSRPGGSFEIDDWAMNLLAELDPAQRERLLLNPDVFSWCESLTINLADELWFTNVNQMNIMIEGVFPNGPSNLTRRKSLIKPHPTLILDENSTDSRNSREEISQYTIGYFGEFYPNRGLSDLFNSLLLLPFNILSRVEVHVYTNSGTGCEAAVRDLGLEDRVFIHSQLPFLDFHRTASRMDLLVVCDVIPGDTYEFNPYLPSKVSDYLGTGTPILAYTWPNSPMSKIDVLLKVSIGDTLGATKIISDQVNGRAHAKS